MADDETPGFLAYVVFIFMVIFSFLGFGVTVCVLYEYMKGGFL